MIGSATGSFRAGFRSGGEGSSDPWNPGIDLTPAFWIDASDTNSYTLDYNNVDVLNDKAGNFVMSRDGTPQRAFNALNMMPAFYFSGSEAFVSKTTGPFASGGNHWSIGIFRWDQVNNSKDSAWSFDGTRTYALSAGAPNRWDGEIDYDGDQNINGLAKNEFTVQVGQGVFVMVGVVFDWYSRQIYGRINGTLRTGVDGYNQPVDDTTDVRIFRNRGSHRPRGYLAEMFHVADRPGSGGKGNIDDLLKAEGYLAHKWGMAGSLPSSHPYKISPP